VEIATHHVSSLLPSAAEINAVLAEAHAQHAGNTSGEVSQVYPALARVEPTLFGLSIVGTTGNVYEVGDTRHHFSIMSASKPFLLALVCKAIGWESVRSSVGANATGKSFNSVAAIEDSIDGRTNPMVNSGAIATTSLAPGTGHEARWRFIQEGLSRFAGRELTIDAEVYASSSETNFRNRSIACFLQTRQRIFCDPMEAVDLYTRQCALAVTARDLAVMGATLASGGVNPLTREHVVDAGDCRIALAVMATAGMYETSGDWLCDVGLPGKSGIGGGIVTVSPGKGGFGSFAPPLDAAGNSVRGVLAARSISERLGFDLFVSAPAV
jgi:glutaminase